MRVFAVAETWIVKWIVPLVRWVAPLVARWRASVIVATVAILSAFILLLTSPSLGDIANLFLIVPMASVSLIGLLICQRGKTKLVCVMLLCFYALFTWQIQENWMEIRTDLRWAAGSRYWKERVLEQPSQADLGMKCGIWDGWGMFAMDTDVYLVYSPDDRLRNYAPSNLSGLPIPVSRVQRLEKQWYSVTFYTSEGWDGCTYFQ